ncbi:MAG TPA: GNAT family N-acetyltransferase [Verrucomicrobiae bacterium]|nr:GNAT family N-acetyltransferase [Verrucomicrobiae bacterium]
MSRCLIRKAREEDCPEIARFAAQLGYPTTDDAVRKRLERLMSSSNDVVFVAETGDGALAGWVHGVLSQFLESDYRVEIAGLVVDEQFHRQGIGRDLVKHVEQWAMENGVDEVSVRCRTTRAQAHSFYEELGYRNVKTQIVFRKTLSSGGSSSARP